MLLKTAERLDLINGDSELFRVWAWVVSMVIFERTDSLKQLRFLKTREKKEYVYI